MYCIYCGTEVGDQTVCPACGAKLPSLNNTPSSTPEEIPAAESPKAEAAPKKVESAPKAASVQKAAPKVTSGTKRSASVCTSPAPKARINVMAIVGFVLSFAANIAGLVCSIIAYKRADNYEWTGKPMAKAGIIVSACSIGISVLSSIIVAIIYSIYGALFFTWLIGGTPTPYI